MTLKECTFYLPADKAFHGHQGRWRAYPHFTEVEAEPQTWGGSSQRMSSPAKEDNRVPNSRVNLESHCRQNLCKGVTGDGYVGQARLTALQEADMPFWGHVVPRSPQVLLPHEHQALRLFQIQVGLLGASVLTADLSAQRSYTCGWPNSHSVTTEHFIP